MNLQKYFQYILITFNVSLALFFCVWQLISSFCLYTALGGKQGDGPRSKCLGVPAELGYDSFYILSFYLILLLLVIFFFLIASEKWINKIKKLTYFFLTLNIIFIAFLFFEV